MNSLVQPILKILNRPEKISVCKHMLLDLLIDILDIVFLGFLLVIINFYTTNQVPVKLGRLQYLFNKNSLTLVSVFFVLYVLKNCLGYYATKSQNTFFYAVSSRLSKRNLWHYLKDDYIKFINVDSSVYLRKISQHPSEFSNYILTNLQQIITQSILILFTIIGILFYHPSLFLTLFLLLLPPVVLLAWFIKRKLREVRTNLKLTGQLILQYLNESLSGYIESNVYGKNGFFVERYYRYQKKMNDYIAIQQTLQILPARLIEVFAILGFLILVAINKWSSGSQAISLLDIGVFMAASYKIIPGIVKISNSAGQIKTYEFTLNELAAYTDAPPADALQIPNINAVKFNNVDFKYRYQQILNNFSFELYPGDFAGISGPSGLGKTTIINLLLGFIEPDNGNIYINHTESSGTDMQRYWNRISYVKQQPFLINDSILKNITLTEDGYDTAKLSEALCISGVDNLFNQYPEGIEKLITENGKNISGGQRQRLMLARAIYHDFDLLILDEPFSEIDEAAEREILAKLQLIAQKGKMIIMITHNKNSLSYCNKIIALDGN